MMIRCPYPLGRDTDTSDNCGEPLLVVISPGRRAGWSAPEEPAEISGLFGTCPHVGAVNRGELDDVRIWEAMDDRAAELATLDEGGEG